MVITIIKLLLTITIIMFLWDIINDHISCHTLPHVLYTWLSKISPKMNYCRMIWFNYCVPISVAVALIYAIWGFNISGS